MQANVDVLVLCDTNGGSLPWEVKEVLMCCSHFLFIFCSHVEICDSPCAKGEGYIYYCDIIDIYFDLERIATSTRREEGIGVPDCPLRNLIDR